MTRGRSENLEVRQRDGRSMTAVSPFMEINISNPGESSGLKSK
jgi:hypothetical protein